MWSIYPLMLWRSPERRCMSVDPATLPQKCKAPVHYDISSSAGSHRGTSEDHHRKIYFEALDLAIACIKGHFDQPGYEKYRNLEEVLMVTTNGKTYTSQFEAVCEFYGEDLDKGLLSVQLLSLDSFFTGKDKATIADCIAGICSMTTAQCALFSEVWKVAHLVLIMPATNAAGERSFSAMRRLKTYLRSTMQQSRLNNIMLLIINKDCVDKLDLTAIGEEFVRGNEHRLHHLGYFSEKFAASFPC